MILVIVSVRDAKMEAFGRPVFVTTVGGAIRSFDDEVNRDERDNQMFAHPEDFQLYQLGTFDDNTGEFKSIMPKLLVSGNEVKRTFYDATKVSKV